MPGAYRFCCMPGCSVSSARCSNVITFHSLPLGIKDADWRAALINKINRADKSFNPKNAKICSRHFEETCFKTYGSSGKRTLITGSLPTKEVQQKSIETAKPPPRKPPVSRPLPPVPVRVAYYNFDEVKRDTLRLATPWTLLQSSDDRIEVGVTEGSQVTLRVLVKSDLTVQVLVHGFQAISDVTTIESISLNKFLRDLNQTQICPGVTEDSLQRYADLPSGDNPHYFKHVFGYSVDSINISCKTCVRSRGCEFLLRDSVMLCIRCKAAKSLLVRKEHRAVASADRPIGKHDPLQTLSREKLCAAFKASRKQELSLQTEVDSFKQDLSKSDATIVVEDTLHNSLTDVLNVADLPALTKMFWEEQLKAFCRKEKGMRWHPMLIRLAILIHSRSPSVYTTLRQTGILKLPGESTLREYTNVYGPQDGFNMQACDELVRQSEKLKEEERFVVLLHDEMSIRSDLVYDPRAEKVIGFVNRDKWTDDIGSSLATQVLVFYAVGVNSNIKISLGFFGTKAAAAGDMFPLLWEAVQYLEDVGLKVIGSTSDKASGNQKLYSMHDVATAKDEVCYKALNLYSPDRFLYFVSDAPHLIKTVRNILSNSGSRKKTNLLWCNGQEMLWQHVRNLYNFDSAQELRHTKLTQNHVNLTSSSVMNVKLAVQVLSKSVGTMLIAHGDPDAAELAELILLMNRFFDCCNTRSTVEGKQKRNPDLDPYTSTDDPRFTFLLEDFLGYFKTWKQSIADRPGAFTPQERGKMFLTHQTYKGLVMTVKSVCEATKYLLSKGVPQVFSNVFCQDPLEQHFGRHRGLGRRCDNPNLLAFSYQEDRIRIQRSLALQLQPKGNVEQRKSAPVVISTSPLKKVQRKH